MKMDDSDLVAITEILLDSSSSSSSSDSDSGDDFFHLSKLFQRNARHSVENFVQGVVAKYSEEEFRRHFRVTRRTAEMIAEKYAASNHFKKRTKSGGRIGTSAEAQTLAFLWFAGNKNTYREVSNLFNMSLSTAFRNQTTFLSFLYDISSDHIKMPKTNAEKDEISEEFKKLAGLENVLGCIDGTYIYIRNPAHKIRSTYVNRHGLISITMQGICDANKKFLDVFVGSSSKIHDARIFKLSHVAKEIQLICGTKYHLLGDAAYPLREFLLTPYRDYGDLTEKQKKYNKKHCQTRVKIENAFGLLKQRFRQLTRLDCHSVFRMSNFVLACCVLHNLCIDEGDVWEDENDSDSSNNSNQNISRRQTESMDETVLLHKGEIKRNTIADNL